MAIPLVYVDDSILRNDMIVSPRDACLKYKKNKIRVAEVCRQEIALMPKSVEDLREVE
jgi:hypothetical protein